MRNRSNDLDPAAASGMHVGGLDHGRVAAVPRLPAMFSGRRKVDGKTLLAYVTTLPAQQVQARKTGKLEAGEGC